ncbi:hypothetical protein, partial [Duodenibacillus massiliensis]|uniref:hypothetical protein n=1 Tax=Duodenibacillus massiliensis TaxID=1852381 RepID=UPI0030781968
IAAEYTLSENYVHGLAAFAPRLKNFESPHSSRGSSPGLPAGNLVKHVISGTAGTTELRSLSKPMAVLMVRILQICLEKNNKRHS